MRKNTFPNIGLRNIKTGLSVFICMILFQIFKRNDPFYACIAAVICMKDTVENSRLIGINRLIGTFLGGLLGILAIYITSLLNISSFFSPIVTSLGIILTIYICTLLKKPGAVTIACIVYIGIMINHTGSNSYYYAVNRIFDTSIGVIIAIFINKYIKPPIK